MFVTSRLLAAAGVVHGFSVRRGGVSRGAFASLNVSTAVGDDAAAVEENLRRLAKAVGVASFATAHQVHGDRVIAADGREILAPSGPQDEGADAVVALEEGKAVGVRVADCVPILLYDEASGAVAAVHSGWRGTKLQIAARAVRALQHAAGAEPKAMLAAIGPSIGRCCYEVSEELAGSFRAQFGGDALEGRRLDLRRCIERSLREAGVPPERIEQVEGCTSCDIRAYFSHRRDKGRTGRHLAFIAAK
jgi:YfiH family protein